MSFKITYRTVNVHNPHNFLSNKNMLLFCFRISKHVSSSSAKKSMLEKALDSKDFKVKYLSYDWTHNEKKK
jgi:tyrosyl-tRNA synthetase